MNERFKQKFLEAKKKEKRKNVDEKIESKKIKIFNVIAFTTRLIYFLVKMKTFSLSKHLL
jgi:hypothetical protein